MIRTIAGIRRAFPKVRISPCILRRFLTERGSEFDRRIPLLRPRRELSEAIPQFFDLLILPGHVAEWIGLTIRLLAGLRLRGGRVWRFRRLSKDSHSLVKSSPFL